jgi:CubicO group peptidase (beta-lactamase class C family)
MEQVIQHYIDSKQFMGTVLVARDSAILLDKGYGSANLEWDIANVPSAKFRLGSVTKQFTAACILLLEERGKLKLDVPVKTYLPDAPPAWDKVTIFHLLTHTSGIPSFTDFPDYKDTQATPTTPEKLVARFKEKPLEFQPGEQWKYSNSGYVLLGYLIEKVSGQSYAQFVQDNIFTPLGMRDSGYDSNHAVIWHRASGYTSENGKIINADYVAMSIPFSAGALYSTNEDLLRWEQGLMGGKLLSPASLQKMTTPYRHDYALGVGVQTVNGRKVISHGGGIEGFNTELDFYPDDKLTVVVLANLNGKAPGEIATKLAAVAHGEPTTLTSEQREISVPEAVLRQYVGTYQIQPGVDVTMTLEGGQLMTQITGQPKFPVYAESESKFFLKVVEAEIEFFPTDKGGSAYLVIHQGGQEVKAIKK